MQVRVSKWLKVRYIKSSAAKDVVRIANFSALVGGSPHITNKDRGIDLRRSGQNKVQGIVARWASR